MTGKVENILKDSVEMMKRNNCPSDKKKQSDEIQERNRQALRDIRIFLIKLLIIAFMGWVLLGFVFGITVMEGEDMYPRIRDGDVLVYYRLQQEYHIGDVVTFKRDGRRYTGRIVAQEGDTVNITEEGQLIVNGNVQDEEIFYPTDIMDSSMTFPCEILEGSVFLLCDFRTNSTDSRIYGPVDIEELDGKVMTIVRRRGI